MSTLSDHTAAGQALGYYFQLERSLSWLAKAPANSFVGIETEDDVVVKLLNGGAIYEQDKSSTTVHPFLPSRKDLWKTLVIWAEGIENDEIDVENSFFYLVTNKEGKDSLAAVLAAATEELGISNAIVALKEKGNETTGEVKALVEKLFAYNNDLLSALIKRIHYETGNAVYGEGLKKKLEEDLQLDMETPEQNTSIIQELLGWVFNQVVSSWREKKPALIDRNAFHRQKINIITNYRKTIVDDIIIALGEIPEKLQRDQWQNRYVQQLELINCTKDDIYKAIHQYLNSVAKRSQLAKKGYLTEKQLEEFDRSLEEHWNSIFRSRKISHKALPPEDIGQLIYFDTTDHDTSVGQFVLKSHFITKGSYHALADGLKVGWHPEFPLHFKLKGAKLIPRKEKKNA